METIVKFIKDHFAGIVSVVAIIISILSAYFSYQSNQLASAGKYKEFWDTVRLSYRKEKKLDESLNKILPDYIRELVIKKKLLEGQLKTKRQCNSLINNNKIITKVIEALIQNIYQQYYWYVFTELSENKNAEILSIKNWTTFQSNRSKIIGWVNGLALAVTSSSLSIAHDAWQCSIPDSISKKDLDQSIKLISQDIKKLNEYEVELETTIDQPILQVYGSLIDSNS